MQFSLLLLVFVLPLSAAALPPRAHRFHSTDYIRSTSQQSFPESIEVLRPLSFDSLDPSCTLPVFSHSFGDTVGLPATVANYSPPIGCTWSRAVLHLSGSCNGSQSDRIAAVWLSGVELLRTSTPKPTSDGIFWNVRKDVSRYSSLLRKSNISLAVMLENAVDAIDDGVYQLNLTLMYYSSAGAPTAEVNSDSQLSLLQQRIEKLREKSKVLNLQDAFNLNENPADLIIPISANADRGFWFKIHNESDGVNERIQIPANTYKAVLEIYVSFHGNDESWYSNPPNSYIEKNHLPTERGNGAYREIEVKIDDISVGSVIPFPVIFAGGINPLFWKPLAPIGAFNLPSYQLELTPFLSTLLDGKSHSFHLEVINAISYWLVDANLHLWLDSGSEKVIARSIKYRNPNTRVQRTEQFRQLEGTARVQGQRLGQFTGLVSYSGGNFTIKVEHKLVVDNIVEFKKYGKEKRAKLQVEMITIVKVKFKGRQSHTSNEQVEGKYYLNTVTTESPNSSVASTLENRVTGRRVKGQWSQDYDNTQKCRGQTLAVARNGEEPILAAGSATTYNNYEERDRQRCYRRRVYAEGGSIKNDTTTHPCGGVAAASSSM